MTSSKNLHKNIFLTEKPRTSVSLRRVLDHIVNNILFEYQREWLGDRSRFKIACKARQIGLSLCIGFEGLLDVLRGEPVYYVSRTERQSVYLLEKFYFWCDFLKECGVRLQFESQTRNECRIRVNGRSIDVKSLTSNATGDEGYTGNVYLDEFALHEDAERIYRSLFPTIALGYTIRIISRPFGQSNTFYDIFTDERRYPDFRRHRFDINRAVRDGISINVDELRRNLDDEGFRENFLCEFIDESTSYMPYQLIRSCVGDAPAELGGGATGVGRGGGTSYLGVDVGRKRDLTVLFVLTQLGDKLYTKRIERLNNAPFEDQKAFIRHVIRTEHIRRGCIDASGLGMQLAEELQQEFGFIEPVAFTSELKERLAILAKRKFENRQIQIPNDDNLVSSIHSIRKVVTPSNNIRFDAERTADGHADEFWALALAIEAATENMPQLSFLDMGMGEEQDNDAVWREM